MEIVFSNKYLLIKVIIIVFVLILLSFYCYITNSAKLTLTECIRNPEQYDKVLLQIGGGAKVGKVEKDRFELLKGNYSIRVTGSVEGLGENEYINLEAIFHKEGYLEVEKAHVLKLRRLKMVISFLPVLLIVWLFFKTYRFKFHKLTFIEK